MAAPKQHSPAIVPTSVGFQSLKSTVMPVYVCKCICDMLSQWYQLRGGLLQFGADRTRLEGLAQDEGLTKSLAASVFRTRKSD